jgi:hypothetical protein
VVPEQLEDLGRVERHLAVARVRRQGQLRAQVLLEEVPPPEPHELDAVLEAEVEEPAREVLEDALREHPLEAEGAGAAPAQRRVRLVDPARELLRPPFQILVEAVARRVAPRRAQDLQRLLQGPAPRPRVLEDVRFCDLVELLVAADDAGQRVEREPEPRAAAVLPRQDDVGLQSPPGVGVAVGSRGRRALAPGLAEGRRQLRLVHEAALRGRAGFVVRREAALRGYRALVALLFGCAMVPTAGARCDEQEQRARTTQPHHR